MATSPKAAKTCGSVVAAPASARTLRAPWMPWAPETCPRPIKWVGDPCSLFKDLQNRPFANLGGGGAENGAHGSGRTPLLADNLPQIFFGHLELDNRGQIGRVHV